MDDTRKPEELVEELPAEEPENEPQPKPARIPSAVPLVPVTRAAKGKEPWKQGSGCGGRLTAYGCAIGVMILIGILMAGASLLRRGVWTTMEKGRRAVARSLPPEMTEDERRRTAQNLDRFRRVLEVADDPYPVMGQFMKRVRASLADGRLTTLEAEEINVFLEKVIEESGIPLMQLGFRISDFGFRICSLDSHFGDGFRASIPRVQRPEAGVPLFLFSGRVGGNPKFEIRNSKSSPV